IGPLQGQTLQHDLGVAGGVKRHTRFFETRTHRLVVVNLAVINDAQTSSSVPHWLVTTGESDNAQSSHPEREAVAAPRSFVVGSAVRDRIGHRFDRRTQLFPAETAGYAINTAHRLLCDARETYAPRMKSWCDDMINS